MSFFKNASIRTKILSLILPLCIVGLGAAAFMATRYKESDALYSEFIGSDNAALVELARANRNLIGLAYGAYQVMAYDANAAEINVARQAYIASKRELLERLDNVKAVFPEERAAVDVLIAQSQSIAEITDKAVELGMANKNAESAVQLVKADASIQIMSATITMLLDKLAWSPSHCRPWRKRDGRWSCGASRSCKARSEPASRSERSAGHDRSTAGNPGTG